MPQAYVGMEEIKAQAAFEPAHPVADVHAEHAVIADQLEATQAEEGEDEKSG